MPDAADKPVEPVTEGALNLAAQLDESNVEQVAKIVACMGQERAQAFADIARRVKELGGLAKRDGGARSLGGIFFFLASQTRDGSRAWAGGVSRPKPARRGKRMAEPISWDEFLKLELGEKGEVNNVKITLTGKPGQVTKTETFVALTLTFRGKLPSLPKGLPSPPSSPTDYLVLVATKQWRKVETALALDNEDFLIIEGWCAMDEEGEKIVVWATHVTTRRIQEQERTLAREQAKRPEPV